MTGLFEPAAEATTSCFAEETVARYGRVIVASLLGFAWISNLNRQPSDVQHALRGLLPQGFDRSILSAKLQSQRTKIQVNECLQLAPLQAILRSRQTDKLEKARCLRELWKRVLTGVFAESYLHALTITLFCVKNSVRVLCFVLQERDSKERRRLMDQQLAFSSPLHPTRRTMLSTWWHHGWKEVLFQRMQASSGWSEMLNPGVSSPFPVDILEEESMNGMRSQQNEAMEILKWSQSGEELLENRDRIEHASEEDKERTRESISVYSKASNPLHHNALHCISQSHLPVSSSLLPWLDGMQSSAAIAEALENAFSVRSYVEAAVPLVVADVRKVITAMFESDRSLEKTFAPTAMIKQEDLASFFSTLMTAMERELRVEDWLKGPFSSRTSAPSSQETSISPNETHSAVKDTTESPSRNQFSPSAFHFPEEVSKSTPLEDQEKPEKGDMGREESKEEGQNTAVGVFCTAPASTTEMNESTEMESSTALWNSKTSEIDEEVSDEEDEVKFGELAAHQQKAAVAVAIHEKELQEHGHRDFGSDMHSHSNKSSVEESDKALFDGNGASVSGPSPFSVPLPPLPGSDPSAAAQDAPSAQPFHPYQNCCVALSPDPQTALHTAFEPPASTMVSSLYPPANQFIKAIRERMVVPEEMEEPIAFLLLLAECFLNVMHTESFSELVLVDSQRILCGVLKNATRLNDLRRFNPETNSAPMPMVSTCLEDLRQRLSDENFVIPEYLSLFCSELTRCSLSRK